MQRPEWLAERGGKVELLRVPAVLFRAVSGVRAKLYDRGILPVAKLDLPVISVGNLSTGGTGKTPFVAFLCGALERRGLRAGILSRGFGARAGEAGDEAKMLARALAQVPHVADPDRVRGGQVLVEAQSCDVIVLDDGFQHRRLWRDLDLVLVDATRPWGLPAPEDGGAPLRALLPRGLLREAPRALGRADAIVITRTDQVAPERLEQLEAELATWAPGPPILHAAHRPRGLRELDGRPLPETPAQALAGRALELVSAIGNPDGFEATVRSLGAHVLSHRRFPDHHSFDSEDLRGLGEDGRWILTTEKDATKLVGLVAGATQRILVLSVELELVTGHAVLEALLESLPRGNPERRRRGLHEGLHG